MATIMNNDAGSSDDLKNHVLSLSPPAQPEIRPYYSKVGDFLSYCWEPDDPFFARRIDEFLTAYYSTKTKKLVGCKIKGVNHLLSQIRQKMRMRASVITMEGLSVAGRGLANQPPGRDTYEPIWESTRNAEVREPELDLAGCGQ